MLGHTGKKNTHALTMRDVCRSSLWVAIIFSWFFSRASWPCILTAFMPFAFVSDNLSFPFQSQGLINLVLNWKFCLSTRFHRTQLSGHPKTKAMAASASSAGHSTFESVAFFLLIPYHGRRDGRHRRRPHTTPSWSLLYRVLILMIKVESL